MYGKIAETGFECSFYTGASREKVSVLDPVGDCMFAMLEKANDGFDGSFIPMSRRKHLPR